MQLIVFFKTKHYVRSVNHFCQENCLYLERNDASSLAWSISHDFTLHLILFHLSPTPHLISLPSEVCQALHSPKLRLDLVSQPWGCRETYSLNAYAGTRSGTINIIFDRCLSNLLSKQHGYKNLQLTQLEVSLSVHSKPSLQQKNAVLSFSFPTQKRNLLIDIL